MIIRERIIPVILTLNEGPNIGRILSKLTWAYTVIVLDSHSNDDTEEIARTFDNVLFCQRRFDCAANQWNAGVKLASQWGDWILALDADYLLSNGLVEELKGLETDAEVAGYEGRFVYCIDGSPLTASLYPPHTVLFRAGLGRYVQDGHTQRLSLGGKVKRLVNPIFHDDRKSWRCWYHNQIRYARLEAEKVRTSSWTALSLSGKVRWIPPFSIVLPPIYLLAFKGLWRDGLRGLKYVWQRLVAEWLIQRALWFKALG